MLIYQKIIDELNENKMRKFDHCCFMENSYSLNLSLKVRSVDYWGSTYFYRIFIHEWLSNKDILFYLPSKFVLLKEGKEGFVKNTKKVWRNFVRHEILKFKLLAQRFPPITIGCVKSLQKF